MCKTASNTDETQRVETNGRFMQDRGILEISLPNRLFFKSSIAFYV